MGSSSVKASVMDGNSGECLATAFYQEKEMEITSIRSGWAEQEPSLWWENLKAAISFCTQALGNKKEAIGAIGISYQMHGLVTVDKDFNPLRPSII